MVRTAPHSEAPSTGVFGPANRASRVHPTASCDAPFLDLRSRAHGAVQIVEALRRGSERKTSKSLSTEAAEASVQPRSVCEVSSLRSLSNQFVETRQWTPLQATKDHRLKHQPRRLSSRPRFTLTATAVAALVLAVVSGCGTSAPAEDSATTHQAVTSGWASGSAYAVGELVTYGGNTYRCIQAHTAQVGWEPPKVPALWAFEASGTGTGGASGSGGSVGTGGTTNTNPLTLDYVTLQTDCNVDPAACCTPGSVVLSLTDNADTFSGSESGKCVLARSGDDTVAYTPSGASALNLGNGNDTAIDGPNDNFIWAGRGDDTINGHGGTNLFFGGWGRDTIMAANGTNTVIPGPESDTVALGNGNDTLYIFDLCEVVGGETLDGGGGTDTLVIPVPLEALRANGVSVSNFENVVVQQNSCRSECNPKADCSGHGTCSEGATTGEVSCACAAGFAGAACERPDFELPTTNGPAPSLTGSETAEVRVGRFLEWVTYATNADLGKAVAKIYEVHGDAALGTELVNRFNAARNVDASRALMILSVLGEMRTAPGRKLFKRLLAEPVPAPSGAEHDVVRERLLGYQIKAVHGLGYLFSGAADQELLHLAGSHPQRVIRAAAIRTYVFNQGDAARETARAAAKPGEEWFADRFENRNMNSGTTFDERLQEFEAKHPELN